MRPNRNPNCNLPRLIAERRAPAWRFYLAAAVVFTASFCPTFDFFREDIAPTGTATPAEPRHSELISVRVDSNYPAERNINPCWKGSRTAGLKEKRIECWDGSCTAGPKRQYNHNPSINLLGRTRIPDEQNDIRLCQALGPAAPCDIRGIDCATCRCSRRGWEALRAIQWQAYAQGEYVGHARLAHVPEYLLRVDDQLDMVYRITRDEMATPYKLNVGDRIQVESFTDPEINRELLIQPDGTITLRLLGQVHATGLSVDQLRQSLDEKYCKYYKIPAITVTPLKVNTKLEDMRATVDRRAGIGGQSQFVRITPAGTISLPGIGEVRAQCLTLPELQVELNECYRQVVEGLQVVPILVKRAPRYVYVLGEVNNPGRFELTGPTTAIQSISMAGSWKVGANLRQIVVFRRGDDWRLLATMINLQAALLGNQPCPRGEIWIDDSDIIIVPKSPILVTDDWINLVFTRGIYGVFPLTSAINFTKLSSL